MAIDDVQWLDRSSAAALQFAFRRLRDEPVALLLARRPGDADEGLEQALPAEQVLRVEIGPLDFLAMNRVVQDRLGTVLARPLLHRVHELSGGNPFFALELARAPEMLDAKALPPTLDVLVHDRLQALPEEAQRGLLVAAAAAKPTCALVDEVVSPGALDAAEAAGFVAIDHGSVRFLHPLLASGAYGSADPARRREVHQRLAEVVPDPVERAYHLAEAATGPDERVAAGLDKGALRARARGAPAVAARLSQEAAELTPPELAESRLRRIAAAGYYHFESGDSRRGVVLLEEAAAQLEPGPARADVLTRLAYVHSYSDDLAAATDLFLQAAEEAGDDDGLRARALEGASAQLFRRRRRLDEAVEHAGEAAALARELGDDSLLAQALSSRLLAEATLGRPEAAATLEAALELQPAVGAERVIAQPEWTAAVARMWWEDPDALRSRSDNLIEQARAAGDEGSLAYVYVLLAQAECLVGDFDHGRRNAEAAREIAEQAGQQALVGYGLAVRAWCDAHSGREPEAREAAEAALEIGRSTEFMPVCQFAGSGARAARAVARPCGRGGRVARVAGRARANRGDRRARPYPLRPRLRRGAGRARPARGGRRAARLVPGQRRAARAAGRDRSVTPVPRAARGGRGPAGRRSGGVRAGARRARRGPAAVRQGPDAPRLRSRAAPRQAKGRRPRPARAGRGRLRGAVRLGLPRPRERRARADRRPSALRGRPDPNGAPDRRAGRRGPLQQGGRGGALRLGQDRRGEPLARLREARPARAGRARTARDRGGRRGETVGVSPISIGSWRAYRRGMERKSQTEGEGSMYKRILRKRILKGLVVSLALFAVIPISNAAAKPVSLGQPDPWFQTVLANQRYQQNQIGVSGPELAAMNARGELLNKKYGLGQYASRSSEISTGLTGETFGPTKQELAAMNARGEG